MLLARKSTDGNGAYMRNIYFIQIRLVEHGDSIWVNVVASAIDMHTRTRNVYQSIHNKETDWRLCPFELNYRMQML